MTRKIDGVASTPSPSNVADERRAASPHQVVVLTAWLMRHRAWFSAVMLSLSILTVACGDSDTELPGDASADSGASTDAGRLDSGRRDATPADVSPADAEAIDVAPVDAGGVDAADADGAATDASPIDADVPDADPADAGSTDALPPCLDPDASTTSGCLAALPVFSTGVDSVGVVAQGGTVDLHYTLLQSAEPTLPGPDAIVVSQIAAGYWLGDNGTSQWIAPSEDQRYPGATPCNADGTYVYRTRFDLTGFEPSSARLSGGWAADNAGTNIYLNGTALGLTTPSYGSLNPFVIESGFQPGINTLDFEVSDFGCPNGLRVELVGTASVAN